MSKVKTQEIWMAVNKNGKIVIYLDEPKREEKLGIWKGKYPYVNSVIYKQFTDMADKAKLTWESEPNAFSIQVDALN